MTARSAHEVEGGPRRAPPRRGRRSKISGRPPIRDGRRRLDSPRSASFGSIPHRRSFYATSHICFAAYLSLLLLVQALPGEDYPSLPQPPMEFRHAAASSCCGVLWRAGWPQHGSSSATQSASANSSTAASRVAVVDDLASPPPTAPHGGVAGHV